MSSKLFFNTAVGASPPPTPPELTNFITFQVDDSGGAINHDFTFLFTATNIFVKIWWGDGTTEVLSAANAGNNYNFNKNFQCPAQIKVGWTGANMVELTCYTNNITSIDTEELPALTTLSCDTNKITSFDFSLIPAAENIICYFNQFVTVDLSSNPNAIDVEFNDCALTSINVTGCTAMTYFDIGNNSITTLTGLATCVALEEFFPHENLLTSFDFSTNTQLFRLTANIMPLASLNTTGCTLLKFVIIDNCELDVTTISNLLIFLDANGITNGGFNSSGQTPAAVPNAGGQTAKASLIIKTWSVTTD